MYLKRVEIKDSGIEGKGVFAAEDVGNGDLVWKFDSHHDLTLSQEEYDALNIEVQVDIRKVGLSTRRRFSTLYESFRNE